MDVGGNATMLEVAMMLQSVWTNEQKYANKTTIINFWKSSNILPAILCCYESTTTTNNIEDIDDLVATMSDLVMATHRTNFNL